MVALTAVGGHVPLITIQQVSVMFAFPVVMQALVFTQQILVALTFAVCSCSYQVLVTTHQVHNYSSRLYTARCSYQALLTIHQVHNYQSPLAYTTLCSHQAFVTTQQVQIPAFKPCL